MRSCLLLTLTLVIEAIKVLDSGTSPFYKDQTATVLIETFVDFLYRLKDRYPYSTIGFYLCSSKIKEDMEVFYTIIEFLILNGYLPSATLLKEYSKSKVTRELNTLPTREYINSKFDKIYEMSKERYEQLRKRFESRPPFVFYFNPSIGFQKKVCFGWLLKIGFFENGTKVSVNK